MNSLKKLKLIFFSFALFLSILFAFYIKAGINSDKAAVYGYKIIHQYPHDRHAFTQGLVYKDGVLYEGTGLYGHSELRKVEIETGKILQKRKLADPVFGEGITIFGDRIIQLTWQSHIGFVYDIKTFDLIKTFSYPMEGWGITHDGKQLIISDGTSVLHFINPETFKEINQLHVYDAKGPLTNLNELEYIDGEIYSNVWQTDRIARISPDTGKVTGWLLLEGLLSHIDRTEPVDVLNGIAYDEKNNRMYVTGKLWPKLFEIKLVSTKETK